MTDNLILHFILAWQYQVHSCLIIIVFSPLFSTEFFHIFSVVEEDAKYMAKRKMLGNIKFMGELGKMEIVHDTILHR